jgi:NADPH:quinone reductase-like Zn-dependent oxidoreductase
MRARCVVVERFGGPEVVTVAEREVPPPARGELTVRVGASGVALGDVLARRGLVPGFRPPFTPGYEVAGVVEATGAAVTSVREGDRVAAIVLRGGNAERVNVPALVAVPVPATLDDAAAAALALDGVTAFRLLHRAAAVRRGERVLVHGAGGGVGTLLVALARHAGAEVLGTVSERKREVAARLGAVPIDYRREDFVEVARRAGGVDVVFDPIGGAHLARSRAALRRGGRLVAFGVGGSLARGEREIATTILRVAAYRLLPDGRKATFFGVAGRRGANDSTLAEDLARVLALGAAGAITPVVSRRLPLAEARRAHALKEEGAEPGKIVLVP